MDKSEDKKRNTYTKNAHGHFICPHCGITKEKQNTMFYHLQTHEGKLPYECNLCKKSFVQKQELALHKLRKHPHDDNLEIEYIMCPFDDCDFSDVRKGNVRIHCIRVHGKEFLNDDTVEWNDVWKCGLCAHECNSQTALYYHLSTCLFEYGVISPTSDFAKRMETL